ncbi:hypothetical protein [Paraburkholderia podalyriae]|uniref:Uncharacterized protein n=1 Tax=Paraburkholderia podalyriae TaxID=1938811 RepID=A0ABR7PUY6_9BURK|nr:hypothetical protein [Paraburkholderia podalyriae]MBC8750089.1 hypothetical protein [Paraburkholderia podalyriae]
MTLLRGDNIGKRPVEQCQCVRFSACIGTHYTAEKFRTLYPLSLSKDKAARTAVQGAGHVRANRHGLCT